MGTSLGSSKLRDEQYYKQLDDDKKYFLLLMLGDFQDAMIIPEEVVRRFKGEIPREIKLETRNGYSYTIVIAKNQEKLVLTVGWRQLIENYDLQIGDSLMFRYKGDSQFIVMIFDKLGREKALSVVVDPFWHRLQDRCNEAHEIGSSKKMDTPWERCKSRTEYHYANLDDEKKYFLMGMMSDFQHKMIIPEEFVQRFKGEFPREIILQTQNCCIYVIGVAKNNGNLVLTVGWEKFVETFGLEMADTIVFRYNGNSQFNVIIFDELGCEKASSVFVDHFLPHVQERQTSATDTVKSSHFHPQPIQTVLPESPPTNQMKVDEPCQGNRTAITISSYSYESGHGVCDVPGSNYVVKKKMKATLSSVQKDQLKDGYITVLKAKLTSAQKEVVKQKVQSMHSEIPIFVAVMHKCNIVVEFCSFPRHYAKKYLGEELHMYLQLLGKKWKVRFTENSGGKKLRSGWKQFVEDNKLKIGDICLLKLLINQRRTMEAYIIPANVASYQSGVQNDAGREVSFRRGAPAHHVDGVRDPDSRLLRITKIEAMEDDDVVAA